MIERFHDLAVWYHDTQSLRKVEVDIGRPRDFEAWYRNALSAGLYDEYHFRWTYIGDRRMNYYGHFCIERQSARDLVHVHFCVYGEVEDKVYDLYTFERVFFGIRGKRPPFEMHVTVVVK